MSQYMYTSLAPLPPVFSHIESSSRPATATSSGSASASAKTAPKSSSSSPLSSSPTVISPTTASPATTALFSKANPADSSRLPPTHKSRHHQHPSTRLQHIRTSSSSSTSRSSNETSTTPTSTTLSIPYTASPTDSRAPASPITHTKHKHHRSVQENRAAADHSHGQGHGSLRSRAPARLRKESGSLAAYAKLALHPPPTPRVGLSPTELKYVAMLDMDVPGRHLTAAKLGGTSPFSRTDSLSSAAPSTASISARTMTSSDHVTAVFDAAKPYVLKNGRTYLADSSLPYPLPVDLAELHRQSMRTLMLIQVFGAPLCSQETHNKAPSRILEVACGSGFWSQMCHRYFAQKGHADIEYTGMDIGPMAASAGDADRSMKWRFVQHDMRQTPWPFDDGEFDMVMVKDLSLVVTSPHSVQTVIEEYYRILRPGGILEFWDSDHQIRMLRPHAAPPPGDEDSAAAVALGAYPISSKTPLSAPLNNFLVEYNSWVHRALEARHLSPVPCTIVGPLLVQECDALKDVSSRRLAIPLSEVRWEREGVGGVVTKDGKSYIETGKGKAKPDAQKKTLTPAQAALRRTAMMTVVQQIQSLEPILRDVSGKSQDEWDGWLGKMMNDLTRENGTSWGECLEVGAWWAVKR
ncbi:hypothetical protein C8034_v002207 [Colletotrichum sidae]|uniref:Methyltransferase domain-containing protein n=1 Tax=Colletotrichum sidae TaxID=1347389 RepID=A0A4R8TCS8_9PEZI|nr:hypothetical protein C8034_v002207 [Colletotrichum sidae]